MKDRQDELPGLWYRHLNGLTVAGWDEEMCRKVVLPSPCRDAG